MPLRSKRSRPPIRPSAIDDGRTRWGPTGRATAIVARTPMPPGEVMALAERLAVPGWRTYGPDDWRIGWQRVRGIGWASFLARAALNGGHTPLSPSEAGALEQQDGGWLNMRIWADEGGGLVELRGELDRRMVEAIEDLLDRVDAREMMRWDPLRDERPDLVGASDG